LNLLGEFESTMDAKGRFLLPVALRKQLPEEQSTAYVINRGFETCLTLYPRQSWEPIEQNLSKLNDFDPKVRAFKRLFLNGTTPVDLDSAGRLLVPRPLIAYAGFEKDIVLMAMNNKIEIWDKSKYQQLFESFNPDAFSALAAEVMKTPNA
jgi:MraZ protein